MTIIIIVIIIIIIIIMIIIIITSRFPSCWSTFSDPKLLGMVLCEHMAPFTVYKFILL